jgi:cell division inhibitor SepF
MGIWDSVKDRIGIGRNKQDYDIDGPYEDGYYQDDYDDYEDDGPGGPGGGAKPASMRSYGVDRADYYNDNHAPLVSQTDLRSQQPALTPQLGQVRDRIPAPQPQPRAARYMDGLPQPEDVVAFKGGLARSDGGLPQLQAQRLRMEDTGRLTPIGGPSAAARGADGGQLVSLDAAGAGAGAGGFVGAVGAGAGTGGLGAAGHGQRGELIDANSRFGNAQSQQRVHRRVETIRPASYADAEQVSTEMKKGVVVVLDLRSTRPELAKRILDFSFGVASALDGQVDRHVDRVYIFTRNGALTDGERALIRA